MTAGSARRAAPRLLVGLAVVAVLLGCGVRPQSEPEPIPGDRLPTATAGPGAAVPVSRDRVWGTRDDRLVPVFVELGGTGVSARITALLALAQREPRPPTSLPPGTRLVSVDQREESLTLTLTREVLSAAERDVPFVLGQLVLTATEEPGVGNVTVLAQDRPVLLVTADGDTLTRPLLRSDFSGLLSGAVGG